MDSAKKAVFLDIDGTLISMGRTDARSADIEQIELFHKLGHLFFLNTGRSLANISANLRDAQWLDGIVAGSGAHVLLTSIKTKDNQPYPAAELKPAVWRGYGCSYKELQSSYLWYGFNTLLTAPEERGIKPLRTNKPAEKPNKHFKTIHRKYIHPDILKKIIEYYLESGTWCLFEGETNIYSLNFANAVVPPPLLEPFPVKNANDFFDIYRDAKITKLTMGGAASAEEKEILGDVLDFYTINGYHEGIIKGESKSKGMLIILEELGIPRENCIAIGDSENDLEMIRCAGTGIAMGNASDELKAAASLITGNVENCGVAQALRIVL